MQRALHGDRSEHLAELFILSSALYFKLSRWRDTQGQLPETTEACRAVLHLACLDLAREENQNRDLSLTRDTQIKAGLAELILGMEDLCSDEYADLHPQSCVTLRKRVKALDKILQRLS